MSSRLRLAVMASHRTEELRRAAQVLARAAREAGPVAEEHDDLEFEYEFDYQEPEPHLDEPYFGADERMVAGAQLFDFEADQRLAA